MNNDHNNNMRRKHLNCHNHKTWWGDDTKFKVDRNEYGETNINGNKNGWNKHLLKHEHEHKVALVKKK